ncbi:MAG: hypothetical protein P8N23_06365 [Methylophilaceae bacterium]|jgi:hypothetical protein|nr:hypothetical protein [Methylophilaceae bacterium]MDG1453905.1 hypothetical protein [Methylophilaceae bacterium]
MTFNAFKNITLSFIATFAFVGLASAADKTYTENEFLNSFSGKSKKVVMEQLGKPVKRQASVKPTNAEKITGKSFKDDKKSNPVKIEMWYYNGIVKYDPTHAYKEVEITFVNDNVGNIAFFNNR